MSKANKGQLTAVKMGHEKTTIRKLITWAAYKRDLAFRPQYKPDCTASQQSVYSNIGDS